MPNIASVLKDEMARVARKEVRAATLGPKKAASGHRTDIASLKRRVLALETELRKFGKAGTKAAPHGAQAEAPSKSSRFSAKGLATQRQRLGLSAEDCALLLGVSSQSVYNWESGNARPRDAFLPGVAALRALGKKEVEARLKALREAR
jgi:DNA-binding transcriptional regulator YiaG